MMREPRFRPVAQFDEWPLGRPQSSRTQGPAQRDNIKGVIYEDGEFADVDNNSNSNSNCGQQQQQQQQQQQDHASVLGRRDPNRQSDPALAEQQHAWNKSRIRKIEQPDRSGHTEGKKILRPSSSSVAPWDSMKCQTTQRLQHQQQQQQQRAGSEQHSDEQHESDARRRAIEQAQGSDWFTLTQTAPVGAPVGERKAPRPAPRKNTAQQLRQQMVALAQQTGRCCSALWQSCLEGDIKNKPFSLVDGGNKLRRSLPFVELLIQLEDSFGDSVSDAALADILGLGDCTDSTPIRYEHFLRLFNA